MNKNPIIFIPGLMGSIGGEMLGYKGKWGFGIASWFYNPFIKKLEELGYTLNKDLFICYYDWRKDCNDIVDEFLYPLMQEVGKYYPQNKLDLICHSMGGLVARTYIQGERFSHNIRNLMLLGTPNHGNIEAYYLWTTGKLMEKSHKDQDLFEIIRKGYIWLISKILDIPLGTGNIERLHSNFPGLGNLIPSNDYGYVLCYKKENNKYRYIGTRYMKYKNHLLNGLNRDIHRLLKRVENVYSFIGINQETDEILVLDRQALLKDKEEHIIGSLTTMAGDGTVTVNSATIAGGYRFILEKSHSGILNGSIDYIKNIYDPDKSLSIEKPMEDQPHLLSMILKTNIDLELKNQGATVLKLTAGKILTKYEFLYEEFGRNYAWILLKDIPKGSYTIKSMVGDKEDYNIYLLGSTVEEELKGDQIEKKDENEILVTFTL